ncbi:MAG TPA: hypothetical protein VK653_06050 [Xanthobacteraceae bacterium]|nr:hypothetical protein [Xanthobacteraceae bacterium]
MDETLFGAKVRSLQGWFDQLNPYADKGSILKIEDVNFRFQNETVSPTLEPLYCFAISAKRYALFNIGIDGRPLIRKASAHGLGHLLAPYGKADAPSSIPPPAAGLVQIGVERWQYYLWYKIICAALDGHPDQVDLNYHPSLGLPAASRYAATTPKLLRWFGKQNNGRPYAYQVKPSNFLLAYQVAPAKINEFPELIDAITDDVSERSTRIKWPKPVAPFDSNPASAAVACFDRETGIPVPPEVLKTYAEALSQYHLRPEHKFLNGDYTDRGITRRRRVTPIAIRQIGKESNKWEEQFYLGEDEGADIDYGSAADDTKVFLNQLRAKVITAGQRRFSREGGISRRTIDRFLKGEKIRPITLARIQRALASQA